MSGNALASKSLGEAPEERRFLSTSEATALERELLDEYRFGWQQLVELYGHASAVAVTKAFPLSLLSRKQRTVLVVCGPEQNGAVGLACARHLRVFDYQPSIFCPVRSADTLHRDLTTQCEKMDIPFLSFLPAEARLIDDAYGLVVDALLGPGVLPAEAGGPCARALATLRRLSIPLVSLDVPSGMPPGQPLCPRLPPPTAPSLSFPTQLFQPRFPCLPSSCSAPTLRTGKLPVAASGDPVSSRSVRVPDHADVSSLLRPGPRGHTAAGPLWGLRGSIRAGASGCPGAGAGGREQGGPCSRRPPVREERAASGSRLRQETSRAGLAEGPG
ncbi:yjeF N-terminal domain-containing protein 3 isoform X1, partial [Cricetulus griseus]|uniref:yjeF N-terminal domain-containing protein 3 isoform X1 n=1 Tax=Cricetulus griseus TaxID=10029 RepID=UPI0015C329DB